MKIKTWLLISYFLVMILPLISIYLLFAWISSFNNEQAMQNILTQTSELNELIAVLDDPELYHPKQMKDAVDALSNSQRFITIYNHTGIVLYSTNPVLHMSPFSVSKEALYQGLYKVEQGYRAYDYKQPVFKGSTLVGFFQIEMARDEWTKGVQKRSWLTLGIFVGVFVLIYGAIMILVNRKFNRRLGALMKEMTAFAHGEILPETATNNDEIGQLKRHFYRIRNQIDTVQQTIEKEQELKAYMVATISHDLKTPLTSIKAYTEAIGNETNLTPAERVEYLDIVMEKADFMSLMLDDLLTYTVLKSPTYEMELVEVEGNEFFEMLISGYEPLGTNKNLSIQAFADVVGTYYVNPKQMVRVVDNLVTNAIQHTKAGDKVWIATFSEKACGAEFLFDFVRETAEFNFEKFTYIVVQNEGTGIVAEKLSKILEPLYQVDEARSKRDDYGTGLGLSITKEIITKHGGDVVVLSEENIGTAVICRIPKKRMD